MEETNKVIINLEDYNKLKESEFALKDIKTRVEVVLSKCDYDSYDKDVHIGDYTSRDLAMAINPEAYKVRLSELKADYIKKNKNKEQ